MTEMHTPISYNSLTEIVSLIQIIIHCDNAFRPSKRISLYIFAIPSKFSPFESGMLVVISPDFMDGPGMGQKYIRKAAPPHGNHLSLLSGQNDTPTNLNLEREK